MKREDSLNDYFNVECLKSHPLAMMYTLSLLDLVVDENELVLLGFIDMFANDIMHISDMVVGGADAVGVLKLACMLSLSTNTICYKADLLVQMTDPINMMKVSHCNRWAFYLLKKEANQCLCKDICSKFLVERAFISPDRLL